VEEELMIALLWTAIVAAGTPQTSADPAQQNAAEQCRPALGRKVKGELADITVSEFHRRGTKTLLKGQMAVLERPPIRPGEMSPTHVRNVSYAYDCQLSGRAPAKVRVSRLEH
jgi:hypothetical protein